MKIRMNNKKRESNHKEGRDKIRVGRQWKEEDGKGKKGKGKQGKKNE